MRQGKVLWMAIATLLFAGPALAEEGVRVQAPNPCGTDLTDPRQPQPKFGEFPDERTAQQSAPCGSVDAEDELLLAIGLEDVERVTELLANGLDPNVRLTEDGITGLMIVETRAMAAAFLGAGAESGLVDDRGEAALHRAAFAPEALEIIPLLVEHGADVNVKATSASEETPFLAASELFFEGRDPKYAEEVLRLLARLGADVDAVDDFGYTVLHVAAVNEKPDLARVAIDLGVDSTVRNGDGATALELARSLNSPKVEALLAESNDQPDP